MKILWDSAFVNIPLDKIGSHLHLRCFVSHVSSYMRLITFAQSHHPSIFRARPIPTEAYHFSIPQHFGVKGQSRAICRGTINSWKCICNMTRNRPVGFHIEWNVTIPQFDIIYTWIGKAYLAVCKNIYVLILYKWRYEQWN